MCAPLCATGGRPAATLAISVAVSIPSQKSDIRPRSIADCGLRIANSKGEHQIRNPQSAIERGLMSGFWLGIDTATEIASVAAGRPPTAQSGAHVQGARRHAAEIIRLVDFALSRLGIRPGDLEGLVVGDGPGSFTGLRIGWAAAKGLAHEAGLELRAIPSLMAAAAGAALKLGAEPVAACFDALRGQVYGAVYVFHPDRVETLVAPAVLTVAELARVAPVEPRVVVGV